MAPTIQIPEEDTLKTINNVLKRRADANRILKKREENMLSAEDYRLMEAQHNNQRFLQPLDADTTNANIYYIRQKFMRYCNHRQLGHWRNTILEQNATKGMIMAFLHWICETYVAKKIKAGKKKTVNQYWRDFKMLYRRVNGCAVNPNDASEVVKYINGELKRKFGLDPTAKSKPVAGSDTLLLLLTQLWARDQSVFPTEDDRIDFAARLLFKSYTGCRPAELVEASKNKATQDPLGEREESTRPRPDQDKTDVVYDDESDGGDDHGYNNIDPFNDDDSTATGGSAAVDSGYETEEPAMAEDSDSYFTSYPNESPGPSYDTAEVDELGDPIRQCKALCYEDICLWKVPNPKAGERDVFAMEVHLRHHKGVDKKPKPTTFLFRENPRPILCPITHILFRAICDGAVLVDGYTSAKPFFSTDLKGLGMGPMKVHWKAEWLKRPVFRRSVWTANGWVKSQTEPMTYATDAFYVSRLGRDTGLEDDLTNYCFRRGTANMVNGSAPDSVRDQVMRQDPLTGVFDAAYLNNCVRFNVQDAFLESEISDDGLTRVFTHMSLRYNPGAPNGVKPEVLAQCLAADPEISDLERRHKTLGTNIKWDHKYIKQAPKETQKEYASLGAQLKNAKKSLKDALDEACRKDYYYRIHNEMMKRQLLRQPNEPMVQEESTEPVIRHQLEERTQVQHILCDLSTNLSSEDVVARKVCAIDLFLALGSRQERKTHKPKVCQTSQILPKVESPDPSPSLERGDFPVVCKPTQCIFCLGNKRLSYKERTFCFSRVSHMMTHVERVHMRKPVGEYHCAHPVCKSDRLVITTEEQFKNHVATRHGINLRVNKNLLRNT